MSRNLPEKTVGSLLLGLYGEDGLLHHVGFTSSIHDEDRKALTAKLERCVSRRVSQAARRAARAAGPPSGQANEPLKPVLVAEVAA
jgi:ATP-dependent DNA ligase